MQTQRAPKKIDTTIGDLAAAFYEAALQEVGERAKAARIAQRMVQDVLRKRG